MNDLDLESANLFVFDIDGVLQGRDGLSREAASILSMLQRASVPFAFLTNDGSSSRRMRLDSFLQASLTLNVSQIYTAAYLANRFLVLNGRPKTLYIGSTDCHPDLSDVQFSSVDPEAVLMGDAQGCEWSHLETAFQAICGGADFLVMQANRYCVLDGKPLLDAGFWAAGLSYCTGREYTVIGKPSIFSYETVCSDYSIEVGRAVMVSDDPISDLKGARDAGMKTVHIVENSATTELRIDTTDYQYSTLREFRLHLQTAFK